MWLINTYITKNYSGGNKSNNVVNFICGEFTRVERFLSVAVDFLVRGHTKFGPDTMFASNENALSREDVTSGLYVIYSWIFTIFDNISF